MTERERLIELLRERQAYGKTAFSIYPISNEEIADHLLGNGVIVPPCKVGDTVYTNFAMQGWYYRDKDRPYSAKIVFMGVNNSEEMGGGLINVLFKKNGNMMQFNFSDIGKTVFLTKEEAEQVLKKEDEGK